MMWWAALSGLVVGAGMVPFGYVAALALLSSWAVVLAFTLWLYRFRSEALATRGVSGPRLARAYVVFLLSSVVGLVAMLSVFLHW